VETGRIAAPLLTVELPRALDPSLKVTLPVAVEGDKVAVSVTLWPYIDGLADEVSVTTEDGAFTVWVNVAEVLAASFESPL
jgi:hypothetical protein